MAVGYANEENKIFEKSSGIFLENFMNFVQILFFLHFALLK